MSLENGIVARRIGTAKEWLYPGAEELPRAGRDTGIFWGLIFWKAVSLCRTSATQYCPLTWGRTTPVSEPVPDCGCPDHVHQRMKVAPKKLKGGMEDIPCSEQGRT